MSVMCYSLFSGFAKGLKFIGSVSHAKIKKDIVKYE